MPQALLSYIWTTTLALVSLLMWPTLSFAQSRALTVRDAIEMQVFIDPHSFSAFSQSEKEVKVSPGNRRFAVVTERGILETNEVESTIWIFDRGAVGRFLSALPGAEPPKPAAVARMAAVANDSAITQLRWLSDHKLAFLGRNKSPERSLFTADVVTGVLEKLTPMGQDVTGFDITGGTVVYAAVRHPNAAPVPSERVITGHDLISLLDPESVPLDSQQERPAGLWVIRHQKVSRVLDRATGKPLQLITNLLALSPSGRSMVVTQYAERVPKAWEGYEPASCDACSQFRLKASPVGKEQLDPISRLGNPKQYALVDLDTGKVDLIDAPFGENLLYPGPEKAIWSRDGQSFMLVNTYLPLENTEGSERQQRLHEPCIALFDRTSKHANCVAIAKVQNGREEYAKTGFGFFLRDVLWNEAANDLILSYETFGNENNPTHHEMAPDLYRNENGHWVMQDPPTLPTSGSLRVELRQDLNEPPALFVSEPNGEHVRKLWDPNPQLNDIRLEEVSVLHWKDKGGREWTGGLVKPPNYVPGHRYPLVIQTHGFNQHEFMTVGAFTTAFAARPIAATGMVVVQVEDRSDLLWAPEEATLNMQGFLALVDHLVDDGMVDPGRVGLIGFSRTGYHTLEALTKTPNRFAAATIADSDFLGYMQSLLSVDSDPRDMPRREGITIFGAQPFGDGLKKWVEMAPAFNLDKVRAPVRIEAHNLLSVLGVWELYAALRLQGKAVDLIQLPDAVHVVTKPLERLESEQGDVDWFDFWLNGHEDPDPSKESQYKRWRELRKLRAE